MGDVKITELSIVDNQITIQYTHDGNPTPSPTPGPPPAPVPTPVPTPGPPPAPVPTPGPPPAPVPTPGPVPTPKPGTFKYYTPNDIIVNYDKNEKTPPVSCQKTKYEASNVSMLDLTNAWIDAGNTKETAKFVLLIAGGEAPQNHKSNPGTFDNTASTGIIQCDSCDKIVNNTNICENIWAATRVVLIPELTPAKSHTRGCVIMDNGNMDSNICNKTPNIIGCSKGKYTPNGPPEFNYIGPFCHTTIGNGVGWSDVDNFPNNYYRQFLASVTNGTFTSIDNLGCITGDGFFSDQLKPCYKKINVPDKILDYNTKDSAYSTTPYASTSSNCSYKTAGAIESISQQIVDCALNNPEITNLLDCPGKLTGIDHNICYLNGCNSKTKENCDKQLNGPSFIDYTDIIPGDKQPYAAGKCYGGPGYCAT